MGRCTLRWQEAGALVLLSAAMMCLEITLTRVFAIAQFYHFAFMVVSLAMLGLGAAGTAIALFPQVTRWPPATLLWATGISFALATLTAFGLFNAVPFDPFSVAWDPGQWLILGGHVIGFTLPFVATGIAVAVLLAQSREKSGIVYGLNLGGAALGALLALTTPSFLGAEGVLMLSASLAALAALSVAGAEHRGHALFALAVLGLSLALNMTRPAPFQVHLSPYKALPQALRYPGARVIWQRWNAFSRVDVVESPGIRFLPGLSVRYTGPIPQQRGLFWDGDNPSPALVTSASFPAAEYLPLAAAFVLHPQPDVLVLSARGGLDVLTAITLGARRVWAVEANPLMVTAAQDVYRLPKVNVVIEGDRAFLRRVDRAFDLIVFSLTTGYRPVRLGAYTLTEDYRYTVDALVDALRRLRPGGMVVLTRWLQTPPSEWVRAFALAITAVERTGGDPATQVVAFRGYNTGTLLIRSQPFTPAEVARLRAFLDTRGWDLAWAPGMQPEWANRHNVLPRPAYYELFSQLLQAENRDLWYAQYTFDVRPPTDDRPFFEHYFRWSQARDVWASLGKTWAPFGGAGYFVVLVMLVLLGLLAGLLIGMPLAVKRHTSRTALPWPKRYPFLYFSALGVGYLFVEIPLIQALILYLNHPIYAFTTVLISLFIFGAIGSWRWGRATPGHTGLAVAVLAMVMAWLLPLAMRQTLGWPLWARALMTVAGLAPLATVMGMPFPRGVYQLGRTANAWTPWVWAINGVFSVLAAPLAVLVALTWGFRVVFGGGVLAYFIAWLSAQAWTRHVPAPPPDR